MDTPPPLDRRPEQNGPTIDMVPASSSESTRSWCIGLHLSGLLLVFPMAHIIVPMIIWLLKRADSPEIDATGREVLNFQISITIYQIAAALLWVILVGFVITGIVTLVWVICPVLAAVKISNGGSYRYPFTIRFLK
jgi:hypothetical protein